MIYKATREIESAIKAKDLRCSVSETDTTSRVFAKFDGKVAKNLEISFISSDNDNDFSVRCFSIANVPEDKMLAAMKAVNDANRNFRFVKFTLDNDRDINAEYDFPSEGENIGPAAVELLMNFVKIIDKCYPKFMTAIWT